MDSLKRQVGGSHYRNFKIQPAEFIIQNGLPWSVGNCIKYLCRYKEKGTPVEDLRKVQHYVEMLLEEELKKPTEKIKKPDVDSARHQAYLRQTGCEGGTCDF